MYDYMDSVSPVGLPGFCFIEFTAEYSTCFGNLLSFMHKICRSHLSRLSLTIKSKLLQCCLLSGLLFQALPIQDMPTVSVV